MIDLFKYQKQSDYTHMSAADKAIWERFIEKYPNAYEQVQYDFRIGDAPAFNTLMDDGTDWEQDKLYRLRIDVIGHTADHIDVIELKPNAGASTIGQVKSYRTLLLRDEFPNKKVGMVIITDQLKQNMAFLCKEENVTLIVV